jgi:hypothetical protein
MIRRLFLLTSLGSVVLGLMMTGCGGGGNPTPPPAIKVTVSPASATVQVGGTAQFSVKIDDGTTLAGVNWTVSCSTTPCGTVSPTSSLSGAAVTYTAPSDPPVSDLAVTLTATSVTDATKSSAATITVPSVVISVTPATATALAGGTRAFTATVTHDASNRGVTWTVSCAAASCGTVSPVSTASGAATTYTAPPPPLTDLQVTVTAASVADYPARATAVVAVPAIVVSMEPHTITVPANTTAQFSATVSNDLANSGITWTLSCSPAPCGSISPMSTASGVATTYIAPPQQSDDLTVMITAESVADTTKYSSASATIPAIRVSAISPNSALLPANTTQEFTATVSYDASNQGVAWQLTQNGTACSPACGTIDPTTTNSGTATTYTAPAAVPAKTIVTLNAASVANRAKVANTNFTLTNGTVKLVPASLGFECKSAAWGGSDCPPPSQVVTLTNSGATVLTIDSIAITGSTQFSQTNDCGGSVNPGNSCAVTVRFAATEDEVTGNMAITDSSVDSPQQVALTGTTSAMDPANTAMARSDLSVTTYAAVPPPTGANIVGTQVLYLTDASREDAYLANGTTRELAVRLWYPASPNSASNCQLAPYTSSAVWRYFAELARVQPFAVKTNSCWNAPVANGPHPVVLFSPGYTATATDYTFLLEDLASRGYVVAAINHTYEATAVELQDGRLARSVVGSHLGAPVLRKHWPLSSAVSVRLLDLKFVLSQIESLNFRRDDPFAGKLDLAKIAVAGHSLGGLTAYLAIEFDPRLKAAVMLDAPVPNALGSATRKPVLIVTAGRQRWEAGECRLWKNLQGPRLAVNLRGTEHVALSDWIWLAKYAVRVGPMGSERTMDALRDYVAAFLDANLRDDASPPLLSGSSMAYSDAVVTTQDQPVCREQ